MLILRDDEEVDIGYFLMIEDLIACNDDGTIASIVLEMHDEIENKQKKSSMTNHNTKKYTLGYVTLDLCCCSWGLKVIVQGFHSQISKKYEETHEDSIASSNKLVASRRNVNEFITKENFMVNTVLYMKTILKREATLGLCVWCNTEMFLLS